MSAGDVLAIVAATVVTMLVAVLAASLSRSTRTLRDLRATVDALQDEALALLDDARTPCGDAAVEVDRVERLVTSAERIDGAVDSASRLAARRCDPVVKAMAFGTGVSRAAQRLRKGETPAPPTRRRGARVDRTVEGVLMFKRLFWLVGRIRARARLVVGGHAPAAPDRGSATPPPDVVDRWSGNVRAAVDGGPNRHADAGSGAEASLATSATGR